MSHLSRQQKQELLVERERIQKVVLPKLRQVMFCQVCRAADKGWDPSKPMNAKQMDIWAKHFAQECMIDMSEEMLRS